MRRLRRRLRRFRRLRSAWLFLLACHAALLDRRCQSNQSFDDLYASSEDPWQHATSEEAIRYHALALDLIRSSTATEGRRALEIGCGEGIFTTRLAAHCRSVLAVDVSEVALARAQRRCAPDEHVRFARWDLRTDPPLGEFDIVACMDTAEYIRRPLAKRRAIAKVARSVTPGGVILVSAVIQNPLVERAIWDRWLLAGAGSIVAQFGKAGPDMIERAVRSTDRHLVALYERGVSS